MRYSRGKAEDSSIEVSANENHAVKIKAHPRN